MNGIKKIESRTLFQPYFKARFQNMQNVITDTAILKFVPYQYKSYYIAYIQQWASWVTGFVPSLHQKDFFATGIGTSIVELFVREIMSGGYRLDCKDNGTAKLVESWAKEHDFDNYLNRMFFFSNGVGNAFSKLTPANNDCYISVYPSTRAFVILNRKNEITRAIFLDRVMANTIDKNNYWIKEDRIMYRGKPYYKIQVGNQSGTITSPVWEFKRESGKLPEQLEECIYDLYGDIKVNKWYELPFKSLGVYNTQNKGVAVALSDINGYSDSSLHTALDILYSIDFNYTSQQMDMYFGRAKVVLPKEMQPKVVYSSQNVSVADGVTFEEAIQPAPLQDEIFTRIDVPNEEQTPIFIQPDFRGDAHKYIRDADLELLAIKLGLSSTTLANHLAQNGVKTATQVDAEDDTTQKTVSNKRELANIAINKMLKDLAEFYGWAGVPDITWNRSSGMTTNENRQLLEEYKAGVMPLREYLKKRWRDLTDVEIERWAKRVEEDEEKKAYNSFQDTLNYERDSIE